MTVVFGDRAEAPDEVTLGRTLGPSRKLWDALVAHIDKHAGGLDREWKFYGAKYGWQMKVTARKRGIVYLVPHAGSFLAAFALNDNAVAALRSQKIPRDLLLTIAASKHYPEGRPARIEVTGAKDLATVKTLLAAKLNA